MPVEIKGETKATETKKANIAKTVIHVGEAGNVKVFQTGQEVTGIDKKDLEYLKENGFLKEA